MIKMQPAHIDWNELWQQARADKTYKAKKAGDWDRKASAFARRNSVSLYTNKFIELLNPEPSWSVLDIGCGPGTIAIPLATIVKHISCLDFSPKMLKILAERAEEKNSQTFQPINFPGPMNGNTMALQSMIWPSHPDLCP